MNTSVHYTRLYFIYHNGTSRLWYNPKNPRPHHTRNEVLPVRRLKLYITVFAIPALAAAAFYLLVPKVGGVAAWAARSIGMPWRKTASRLTAPIPFSLMEVLVALLVVWLLYLLVRLIVSHKRRSTLRGLVAWLAVVAYCAAMILWVWLADYYAPPLYDGVLTGRGITVAELTTVAEYFRDGANRTAGSVTRDENGEFAVPVDEILSLSGFVFDNLTEQFPKLGESHAVAKPLIISGFMSRTGYTGVFFALTGEANVNTKMPRALLAATAAHELAHARGVAHEDAASFFGVAACITSDMKTFQYSGYLEGLLYLGNALYDASPAAYYALSEGYSDDVRRDLKANSDYWAEIVSRNEASPAMSAVSTAVNTAYDGFLRSNGQESGLQTYGECVDLIVEWHITRR